MAERKITYQVHIDAPKDEVWTAIADFGNVANSNPGIKTSYLTSDSTVGVGATRHCDLALYGATVEERIVEWIEGESFRIDIYDSTRIPIIESSGGAFQLEEHNGGTLLTGTLHTGLKYGPVGSAVYSAVLQKQLAKVWKIFLAGVKRHVETGEVIDQDTRVPVDAVSAA